MLSQRIALLIFYIQASPKSNIDTFTKLQHARNKIINNQKYLEKKLHLIDIELKLLLESYFYGDIKLVERVEKYAELAQDIINKKKQTFTEFEQFNREQLLIDLHQVVILFEKSSVTQQISLQRINLALWLLSLLIILFLIFAIFKPMQRWLSKTYQKLLLERNRVKE